MIILFLKWFGKSKTAGSGHSISNVSLIFDVSQGLVNAIANDFSNSSQNVTKSSEEYQEQMAKVQKEYEDEVAQLQKDYSTMSEEKRKEYENVSKTTSRCAYYESYSKFIQQQSLMEH